jgi:hypothetical protein
VATFAWPSRKMSTRRELRRRRRRGSWAGAVAGGRRDGVTERGWEARRPPGFVLLDVEERGTGRASSGPGSEGTGREGGRRERRGAEENGDAHGRQVFPGRAMG